MRMVSCDDIDRNQSPPDLLQALPNVHHDDRRPRTQQLGAMRVILVPLTGDDHDGVALAAAYTIAGSSAASRDTCSATTTSWF